MAMAMAMAMAPRSVRTTMTSSARYTISPPSSSAQNAASGPGSAQPSVIMAKLATGIARA
jgi:hypothetical protein